MTPRPAVTALAARSARRCRAATAPTPSITILSGRAKPPGYHNTLTPAVPSQQTHVVSPVPPGEPHPNKIEHRLFCHITQNWRGRPLTSYEVVINSIAATTTSKGLKVYARLDERDYPKKIEVSDAELAAVNLTRDEFHPEWNYSISPSP